MYYVLFQLLVEKLNVLFLCTMYVLFLLIVLFSKIFVPHAKYTVLLIGTIEYLLSSLLIESVNVKERLGSKYFYLSVFSIYFPPFY